MTRKLIASTFAIAVCAALSACSATPKSEAAEAQMLAYSPPPVPFETPYDAPAPGYYVEPPHANLNGAPRQASRRANCDIRVSRTGRGVAITPVAMADRSITGEYDLVLTKDGVSGSSDATQGGPFSVRAGETLKLGETELSLGRRDHYRVVLTLSDGGREICRREVRS
jgi:hypothetical protein